MKCTICRREIDGEAVVEDITYFEEKYGEDGVVDGVHICKGCAHIERVRERGEHYKEALASFIKDVNNTAFNYDGIEAEALLYAITNEHRYLQNEVMVFLFKVLTAYGNLDDNHFDARNQWAREFAKGASTFMETKGNH